MEKTIPSYRKIKVIGYVTIKSIRICYIFIPANFNLVSIQALTAVIRFLPSPLLPSPQHPISNQLILLHIKM